MRTPPPQRPSLPQIFNLRLDPYERADTTSNTYYDCEQRPHAARGPPIHHAAPCILAAALYIGAAGCTLSGSPLPSGLVPATLDARSNPRPHPAPAPAPGLIDHAWVMVPAQAFVAKMIGTLKDFPSRQKPASFTIDQMLEKLQAGMPSS